MKTNLFKTKVLAWVIMMLSFFGNYIYGQTTVVQFTPTSAGVTWTLPAGFTEFDIEIWGKGANGQYEGGSGGADGGGGGGYLKIAGLKHVAFITYYKVSQTSSNPEYTGINLYDNNNKPIGVLKAFSPKPSTTGTGGTVDYPSELIYTSVISENGGNGSSGTGRGGNGGKGGGPDGGAGGTPDSPDGKAPGGGGVGRAENGSEFPGEGGAGLVRITYTIPPSITTTFNQVAPICKGATLAPLPTTSTNGITGTWDLAINNMATTTYTFTPTAGQDASTATMIIEVNAPPAPTASTPQSFCQGQKVEDLVATGTALKWYSEASGGSELPATEVLTATTYYVSQTVDGCESDRTPVVVTLKAGPSVAVSNLESTPFSCGIGTISFTPNITTANTVLIDETFNAVNTNVCNIYGNAFYEILGQNFVKLTTNINSQNGQLLFNKTSTAPKAFELKFDAFMLNKDGADGFSVNYGEIGNVQSLQEDGNSTGLVLRFKNYNQDRIQLVYNNVQIGSDYNLTLEDGNWWTYTITVSDIGQIGLKRKRLDNTGSEITIFANVTIPDFTTTPNYQWAFAARTGGQNNEHIIDAVKFTDNTPLEFSWDQTNWQKSTTADLSITFNNVPAGFQTVYVRSGNNGCPAQIVGGGIQVKGTTPPTPTFDQIAAICKGGTLTLPTTSINSYTGTWAPALDNMATTTYTFTPAAGECASTATMTITVNEPVTPTFNGNTVVLDKKNSDVANFSPFVVTTAATYRIELWGKGSNGNANVSGDGGGYTGIETSLASGSYNTGFIATSTNYYAYFNDPGGNSRISAEKAIGEPALNMAAYDANLANSTPTKSQGFGGTKNIRGGIGKGGGSSGGGAAGWWGHNGASLDGGASGGDSGTPDNSSDGGDEGQNGKFPGGGAGGNGGVGAEGRILITKIEPFITTYCKGATMNPLPTTSVEGITGTWEPALDNMATTTYTFTPDAGQCASTATLEIVIEEPVTPTFTQIDPICKGAMLEKLPTTSTNNIAGTWSPEVMDNTKTTTYTFTPTAGQCANTTTLEIVINEPVTPTFTQVQPICKGATLAALPTTSTNNIAGTWSPEVMDNTKTNTYTFTPTDMDCKTTATMTIVVKDFVAPTFTQIAPICNGSPVPVLPLTSIEGVTGTWVPAVINNQATTTYTFTANAGECASSTATMNIEVKAIVPLPDVSGETALLVTAENDNIGSCPPDYRGVYGKPEFTPIGIYYRNINESLESRYFMVQEEGGKWSLRYSFGIPFDCFTVNAETSNPVPPVNGWVRNPAFGCTENSIMVNAIKTLSFCEGATVADLLLKFRWDINNPPIIKFYDATNIPIYIENTVALKSGDVFATQTIGGCESAKLPIQITINEIITPTFSSIAPICKGASSPLPPSSDNNINGTWSPSFSSQTIGSATYTFTPATGVCASTATMTIEIINCSVISGLIYENDPNGDTIDGTPLTVDGAYLSIYPAPNTTNVTTIGVPPTPQVLHVVPVIMGTGAYAFPQLPNGRYKIVIGTSPDGSETASYPNVGNYSMTAAAEGKAGTRGDGNPDGITFVTVSDGATTYDGGSNNGRVRADAEVSFALRQLAPLPVRLISFTGKNTENGNELNWKTASETNFSHFDVERSTDAKSFEKIGEIKGNNGEVYQFLDNTALSQAAYYRLKMVDLDGSFDRSKVIFIENTASKIVVSEAYPNPSQGKATINIKASTAGTWTINTYNLLGKMLASQQELLQKGENLIEIKQLGKGLNYIQISNGKKIVTRKVLNF